MQIGIIGLAQSGKTTVFNALTRGKAPLSGHGVTGIMPHIGVVKVPDPRLETLAGIFKPKKLTPAEVSYVDYVGSGRGEKGGGLPPPLIAQLIKADALAHVVRAFEDPHIPHPEGGVNPERDIEGMDLELAFSDLSILKGRLERLKDALKASRGVEREAHLKEDALLSRVKATLEKGIPIRGQQLAEEERKALENYRFLTAKPLLLLLNLGEEGIPQAAAIEEAMAQHYRYPDTRVVALPGKLEMELAELSDAEACEFRSALGIGEGALERVIRISYELLGIISFFTVVSDEVRAWTIPQGTNALKAAGKIHSDMERGFIRAETILYQDLVRCGSLAEARKRGLLRLEGKAYTVQDGDVVTFLFNI